MNTVLFWEKVNVSGWDDCWIWAAGIGTNGYGKFRSNNLLYASHRAAFIITRGQVTPGKHILHKCDNPLCCNPMHLREGTHQANMKEMLAKGRHVPGITPGEENTNSKLTNDQVRAIRQDNRVLRLIAKEYNMSIAQVSKIKRRVSWSHII